MIGRKHSLPGVVGTMRTTRDLVDELYRVKGKAEIIHDRIVHLPMTGDMPGYAGDMIVFALQNHVLRTGIGRAVGDGKGFLVDLPFRRSFSPDAAYFTGPPAGMKFFQGAPVFAVEVRSEGDYGPAAERDLAGKRADYFAAGALVVWDVSLLGAAVVRVFRSGDAENPAAVYGLGQEAEAEPAVPGWTLMVDDLFAA